MLVDNQVRREPKVVLEHQGQLGQRDKREQLGCLVRREPKGFLDHQGERDWPEQLECQEHMVTPVDEEAQDPQDPQGPKAPKDQA